MTALGSVLALARVTWTRVTRGRALWVGVGMGALPLAVGMIMMMLPRGARTGVIFVMIEMLLAILPAMFVGASLGEELEAKTAAYLWSRPIPRWAVLAGKLVTLAPLAAAIVLASWIASTGLTASAMPDAASCVAVVIGAIATSVIAAAIAVVWPSHGMSVTIAYMMFVDLPMGAMPSSIQELAITRQIRTIAGTTDSPIWHGVVGALVITAVWGYLAMRRMRRLEV